MDAEISTVLFVGEKSNTLVLEIIMTSCQPAHAYCGFASVRNVLDCAIVYHGSWLLTSFGSVRSYLSPWTQFNSN